MALSFRTIDLEIDLNTCIQFRKDSFRVSFDGKEDGFDESVLFEALGLFWPPPVAHG
ncbi:MAG: hypothetical protein M1415_11035 [Firmicutes bacterium]|jgi:hypothetical protein|nr:hypothetical protein [Bacillota bacterium]MCL5064986.1 hypothetical protein [Bacillota bacterium]